VDVTSYSCAGFTLGGAKSHIFPKEPYSSAKEPYFSAKSPVYPYIYHEFVDFISYSCASNSCAGFPSAGAKSHIFAKEPYFFPKEPYFSAKEPCVSIYIS